MTDNTRPRLSSSEEDQTQNQTNRNHQLNHKPSNSIRGRPKVNTLPPWAKSHEDDDRLFESVATTIPTSTLPIFNKPLHSNQSQSSLSPAAAASDLQHRQSFVSSHHLNSKYSYHSALARSSISTSTLVADSPLCSDHEFAKSSSRAYSNQLDLLTNHPHQPSSPSLSDDPSQVFNDHRLSPLTGRLSNDNNQFHSNQLSDPSSSTARISLNRLSSPVLHRLKPLITVNGQRRRNTDGSGLNHIQEVDLEGATTTSSSHATIKPDSPSSNNNHLSPPSIHQSPDDRWWQFTLPTKYRRKVEEIISRSGHGIGGLLQLDDRRTLNASDSSINQPKMEMVEIDEDRRKIIALLKRHVLPLPTRQSSIDSNDDPHFYGSVPWAKSPHEAYDPFDYHRNPPNDFPLSAFSRKLSLTPSKQQQQFLRSNPNGNMLDSDKPYSNSIHTHTNLNHEKSRTMNIGTYLMHHPTAPLVCRLLNFLLTLISLALCAAIRKVEIENEASGVLGSSTVFILVVAPLGLVHNLFAIWCEYFGAPIGIWSVSWKMFHTLSELVLVSLWSAGLALSFDDELRSTLRCSMKDSGPIAPSLPAHTPAAKLPKEVHSRLMPVISRQLAANQPTANVNQDLVNQLLASLNQQLRLTHLDSTQIHHLCHLQASLVSIIFLGLALYTLVLVVSLFRIFIKVSRKY